MTDPATDAVEETTSEDTSEETTSTESEEAASDSDAQAADQESTSEEEGQQEDGPAAGRSAKLQKLLDKYKGDEDKLADAVFEQYNSASRLKNELDELKGLLKSTLQQQATPPSPPQEHPDIAGLKEQIGALETEKTSNHQERSRILTQVNTVNREIAKLEGRIEAADDLDKPRLEHSKYLKDLELSRLQKDWTDIDRSEKRLEWEKRDLDRKIKAVEREVAVERAREQTQRAEEYEYQKGFVEEFRTAVDEAADAMGVPPGDERDSLHEILKSQAIAFLRTQPQGTGIEDAAQFVQDKAKKLAGLLGLGKTINFTKKSAQKVQARPAAPSGNGTVRTSHGSPTSLPQLPKGKMTAQQALEWRKKVLG